MDCLALSPVLSRREWQPINWLSLVPKISARRASVSTLVRPLCDKFSHDNPTLFNISSKCRPSNEGMRYLMGSRDDLYFRGRIERLARPVRLLSTLLVSLFRCKRFGDARGDRPCVLTLPTTSLRLRTGSKAKTLSTPKQ